MASDEFTKEELDTIIKALTHIELPPEAKRAVKKQVHWLTLDPGAGKYNAALYQSIVRKLGYDALPRPPKAGAEETGEEGADE